MHQQPEIMDVGPLSVVLPDARHPIDAKGWADLSFAVVLQDNGHSSPALELIASLEARLGVNPAHRRALVFGADSVLKQIREDKRRRRLAEIERAAALRVTERSMPSEDMIEAANESWVTLGKAALAYRDGDKRLAKELRNESKRLALEATQARARQIAAEEQRQDLYHRNTLAAARDEEIITEDFDMKVPVMANVAGTEVLVERLQRVVRVRNVTRDGLFSLRREGAKQEAELRAKKREKITGGLTQRQYQFGIRYRDMFEAHDGGLGSQFRAILSGGGGGRMPEPSVEELVYPKAMAKRIDAARKFAALEAAVDATDRSGRRLDVLRKVAGQGKNIRELAASGSLRTDLRDALAAALDVVVEHLHHARA